MSSAQQSEKAERAARLVDFGVVVLTYLFIALWVVIANLKYRNYDTPTPVHISRFCHHRVLPLTLFGKYWCWISPEYSHERIAGEYLWFWITLFASVIVYIPLYFWAKSRTRMRAALGMLW
jgi:hypothetical protein